MIELEAEERMLIFYQTGGGVLLEENLPRSWKFLTADCALGQTWWTSESPWGDALTGWLRLD